MVLAISKAGTHLERSQISIQQQYTHPGRGGGGGGGGEEVDEE